MQLVARTLFDYSTANYIKAGDMGLRFFRRGRIAPGLTLNLSKSGGSLSMGVRGARYTVGPRGRRSTVGLPGTGLYYTEVSSSSRSGKGKRMTSGGRGPASNNKSVHAPSVQDRLDMGFFKRLVTPAGEVAFVDGCRELAKGHYNAALPYFEKSAHLADGAFAAGFIYLKQENAKQAIRYLKQAEQHYRQLDKSFTKYGMDLTLELPISDHMKAHVGPTLRGVLLTLVEACQFTGDMQEAYEHVHRLRGLEPDDVVILLSEVELLWEANSEHRDTCEHIVQMTKAVENKCHIHTTVLLYKARALIALGMHTAARDVLTTALRRRKDRPVDLLNALRYERAAVYEALGQGARARGDLEKIYASDPGYEDVRGRLRESA